MTKPDRLAKLRTISESIAGHKAVLASLKPERDAMIRAAKTDGYTLREIAEATGLAFQRIDQIVKGAERTP